MDEGRENNMCVEEGGLPLIKKVLYGVFIDNEKSGRSQSWLLYTCCSLISSLVLFLIMTYIVAVLFNQIACFLGDQLRNFLTCEPYQNFS